MDEAKLNGLIEQLKQTVEAAGGTLRDWDMDGWRQWNAYAPSGRLWQANDLSVVQVCVMNEASAMSVFSGHLSYAEYVIGSMQTGLMQVRRGTKDM